MRTQLATLYETVVGWSYTTPPLTVNLKNICYALIGVYIACKVLYYFAYLPVKRYNEIKRVKLYNHMQQNVLPYRQNFASQLCSAALGGEPLGV